MANIVIWVAILLTVSCMSHAVNISTIITDVECTATGSNVALNVAGIDPRPTAVIINGLFRDSSCNVSINNSDSLTSVHVNFSSCNIDATLTDIEFTLYLLHKSAFVSKDDFVVRIRCVEIKTGTVTGTGSVERADHGLKTGEHEIEEDPLNIDMTFENRITGKKLLGAAVHLGTELTLTLTAPVGISFEVTGCTVEATDEIDSKIGPYDISHGGCTVDSSLLSNFINENSVQAGNEPEKISKSKVTAFRLVGQGQYKPLIFKCKLRWCEHDNGACDHTPGTACTPKTTRRRRRQTNDEFERQIDEKTVKSSLYVVLPGYAKPATGTSAVASIDVIVKLSVLLCCGLRYIL